MLLGLSIPRFASAPLWSLSRFGFRNHTQSRERFVVDLCNLLGRSGVDTLARGGCTAIQASYIGVPPPTESFDESCRPKNHYMPVLGLWEVPNYPPNGAKGQERLPSTLQPNPPGMEWAPEARHPKLEPYIRRRSRSSEKRQTPKPPIPISLYHPIPQSRKLHSPPCSNLQSGDRLRSALGILGANLSCFGNSAKFL